MTDRLDTGTHNKQPLRIPQIHRPVDGYPMTGDCLPATDNNNKRPVVALIMYQIREGSNAKEESNWVSLTYEMMLCKFKIKGILDAEYVIKGMGSVNVLVSDRKAESSHLDV